LEIKDKRVLVTGGGARIGSHICRAFAEKGAEILIHCFNSKNKAEKLAVEMSGKNHHVITQDLSEYGAAEKIFAEAGRVDILVNNASVFNVRKLENETEAESLAQFKINFFSPLELMKEFRKRNPAKGCVINILDQRIGKNDPLTGSYALSKKSLRDATMAAALQWAPEIRVNAIAPGPVLPPTNIPDSKMEETLKKVPLGKAVNMRNLCSACLFLAENESITGQIIFADCGQHLL
jgi:hypothetical protein